MKATQFTVAFTKPISIRELERILVAIYGKHNVEVGAGMHASGIPHDWIVIANDRPNRMD